MKQSAIEFFLEAVERAFLCAGIATIVFPLTWLTWNYVVAVSADWPKATLLQAWWGTLLVKVYTYKKP